MSNITLDEWSTILANLCEKLRQAAAYVDVSPQWNGLRDRVVGLCFESNDPLFSGHLMLQLQEDGTLEPSGSINSSTHLPPDPSCAHAYLLVARELVDLVLMAETLTANYVIWTNGRCPCDTCGGDGQGRSGRCKPCGGTGKR